MKEYETPLSHKGNQNEHTQEEELILNIARDARQPQIFKPNYLYMFVGQ